jgi:uncharacterized protein (UPF0335 family)
MANNPTARTADTGGIAGARLRSFVERYENLEAELKTTNTDKKELLAELRGEGFDQPTFKKIITRRAKGSEVVAEEDDLISIYEAAINGTNSRSDEQEAA